MAAPKLSPKDPNAPVLVDMEIDGETVQVLAGMEVRDKAELVGVPFYITGLKQTLNEERQIAYVWVEGEEVATKKTFVFNDSSITGVRGQLLDFLATLKKLDVLDEWIDCRILVPKGVRVSTFPTKNERGQDVTGKVTYLTTAGRRA